MEKDLQLSAVPGTATSIYCPATNGKPTGSAAELSVHKSTLKYRLQRIRELTGLELNDPDVHFNLQLATRAWGTLQALPGRASPHAQSHRLRP